MVTKNKTGEKKGKVKVGKLKLKKETVKDLTGSEEKQIKGGNIWDNVRGGVEYGAVLWTAGLKCTVYK